MPPRVSFVIPVRNDAVRLSRCLESITAMARGMDIEIIVADNGSTDGSPDVARAAGATVMDLPNRPVSVVRNEAAAAARADLIAFVDADHELAPGWADAVMHAMATPAVWAAGANYRAPIDGTWVQQLYDRFRDHVPGERRVGWLPSGNLVVRRAAFEAVRGFDTTLESCEDVDLGRRLRVAGGELVEAGAIRSVHHGDPRTLRALFFAELWRGRDNLRVSFREPLTWRSAPSVFIPIAHLVALLAAIAGAGRVLWTGDATWLAASVSVSAALSTVRAVRLVVRLPAAERVAHAPSAWVVAAVYDAARALALVVRVGHDVRRKG